MEYVRCSNITYEHVPNTYRRMERIFVYAKEEKKSQIAIPRKMILSHGDGGNRARFQFAGCLRVIVAINLNCFFYY